MAIGYPAGELLALTRLRTVAGFTSANTGIGKWGLLNSGKAAFYGILRPGAFDRAPEAMAANATTWRTVIEVWRRYKDDEDSLKDLETKVGVIIASFDQVPHLGDTSGSVLEAMIKSGGEVETRWMKSGGPSWLRQNLILEWQEDGSVNYTG